MSKTEIYVILNNEFTNYFLPIAVENIIDTIKYTNSYEDKKYNTIVSTVTFLLTEKTKHKYFALHNLHLEELEKRCGAKFKIIVLDKDNISEVLNGIKGYLHSDTDYVAFYSANTTWVKNHLIESIKAMQLQKRDWSVSYLELQNDITHKDKVAINYREPNPTNHLVNDIVMGELVIKKSALSKVNFNRGIVKEGDQEFFYPAYALKAELKEYALCDRTTVRHYLEMYPEEQLHYLPENYEFDKTIISEEDKKKIIFSVIVNASNIHNQAQVIDALNSLASQQFPLDNVEIIMISNYDSMILFLSQDQLKEKFPNLKVIFTANHLQDEYGKIQIISWMTGIQQAIGEYITYLDLTEGFIYSPAYLSELYVEYKKSYAKPKWLISNYFDIINYVPRHSNIKILNRGQLFYSIFSHAKMAIQYPAVKAIDKNFVNNDLALLNVLSHFNSQKVDGNIIPKALIQKVK